METLVESPLGVVTKSSEVGQGQILGATVAWFILQGWDDSKLNLFYSWMRGQAHGILPNGTPYYYGSDIDRFQRYMERVAA